MKKILFGIALFTGLSVNAQLADGSTAPDWTLTDINGNSHTLSTYLGQGKTVIIDFSATWSAASWGHHESHLLADLYNAYGPNGSDEIMVFFIEGYASTTMADLQGTGLHTQGNWIEGTPYPIIDDTSQNTPYNIAYWPTIYRVCPNGLIYEQGQSDLASWISSIETSCSQTLTGVTDHGKVEESEVKLCDNAAAANVSATIHNLGTNDITSATVILKENGSQISSATYSGAAISQFGDEPVTFAGVNLTQGNTYEVEITDINGNTPNTPAALLSSNVNVSVSNNTTDLTVTIDLHTDSYANEVYMEITDGSGTVVWSEGNENVAGNFGTGQFPPAADPTNPLSNDSDYTWDVTLTSLDCYTFAIYDYFGDGIGEGGTGAGYDVKNNTGTILFSESDANFGAFEFDAVKNIPGSTNLNELNASNVSIYPNPAKDVLNIELATDATVSIMDLQGRVIATESGNNVTFSVVDLAVGSYMISISNDAETYNEKVVIK